MADDMHHRIHANEFVAHMGLHAAAPVWQYLFGVTMADSAVSAIQNHMVAAQEPLTADQVAEGVHRNLGSEAVSWMWTHFISTGVPRAAEQQAVLMHFVRPTVAPMLDPPVTGHVAKVLRQSDLSALGRLEGLLDMLAHQPADPRDADFVTATGGFINPQAPVRRLTDSIYLSILAPALASG